MDLEHIDSMASVITQALSGDVTMKWKITGVLTDYWSNKIGVVWTINDVLTLAEKREIPLTAHEAKLILERVFQNHDASMGISWSAIGGFLQQHVYNRSKIKKPIVSKIVKNPHRMPVKHRKR